MAKWRIVANEMLPELRHEIDSAEDIMALWVNMGTHYERACTTPRNEDLVTRIQAFAKWCVDAPRNSEPGRDPPTAVQVAFYEHFEVEPN